MIQLSVILAIVAYIGVFYGLQYYKIKEKEENEKQPHNNVMLYMATQAAPEFQWLLGRKKTMQEWRDVANLVNKKAFSQLDGLNDNEFADAMSTLLNIKLQGVK